MPTPIRGQSDLTAEQALAKVRAVSPHDVRPMDTVKYVARMHELCAAHRLSLPVLLAQAIHETGNFGAAGRWSELNPAGLGITTGTDSTPFSIESGADSANVHVWSMLVALRDWDRAAQIALAPVFSSWRQRWETKYRDPVCPRVEHLEDLNQIYSGNRATWATDPLYGVKLLRVMEQTFGASAIAGVVDSSGPLAFGQVPHPPYQNRPIFKPEGFGQNNLGRRSVKGVVWHRMLGTLFGTDDYFRRADVGALTDYGVGVGGHDAWVNDGVILRWNDPHGLQSGWASGPALAPNGDGKWFVETYGVNAVNRDQVSIEVSGKYETPLTEASREAIAALTAYYADQYGIPWNRFPIAPQDGFSFVRWHQEFCGAAYKPCPGSEIIRETNELIERTRTIMKRYQTGAGAISGTFDIEVFASPITYDWLAPEEASQGLDRKIGRTRVFYFPQVYTTVQETPRRQATGANTRVIGPPIEKGVSFRADYCYRSHGVSWVLTPYGTRVRAADLLPKIQISTRGTISVRRTPDAQPEVVRRADV